MSFRANRWRAPVTGAAAGLLVAAAVVGPSALASGGGAVTSPAAAKAAKTAKTAKPATASGAGCPTGAASAQVKAAKRPSANPSPAPFLAAIAMLVQAGTL